jgi:beta-galactosidase
LQLNRGVRSPGQADLSRRTVLRGSALGAAALASLRALGRSSPPAAGGGKPGAGDAVHAGLTQKAAQLGPEPEGTPGVLPSLAQTPGPPRTFDFNQGWLFGGGYAEGSEQPGYDDKRFAPVTLPHTVTPLSWGDWDHAAWEKVWIYRKHFDGSAVGGGRVFADFDGVMTNATVVLNGVTVTNHQGGYLPWSSELTGHLAPGDNVLAVIVDSRLLNVPPDNPVKGTGYTDYLQPGGIYRDVTLRVVPEVFVSDVFAKPVNVLTSPSVDVQVYVDAGSIPDGPVHVTAELLDGSRRVAAASLTGPITTTGTNVAQLSLANLGDVTLWSPDTPKLYTVRATVSGTGGPDHSYQVRTGFRQAVWQPDGFHLNGQRLEIFGLNRHQLFPYLGMAASARLQRRDAEILKNELNCNMVRCSHYPQSPHFLDACDELGLMVWEEPPGWGYVGDEAFQQIVLQNVHDMVVRDRNRPSVVIWATRLNETPNVPHLYAQARQLAYELDGSRQTSGTVTFHSTQGWAEDVFAYDDYSSIAEGHAVLQPPVPGLPYLVSKAVGAFPGARRCRWIEDEAVLALQGRMHAQVHNIAQSDERYAGLLAWCAIDYASIAGEAKIWRTLKTPGVVDTFRVPKPGAAFYRSQVSPQVHPVVMPMFFWDFGPRCPATGPGAESIIATNCDWLAIHLDDEFIRTAYPDTKSYGNLAYPLAFVDLGLDRTDIAADRGRPELRIDGFIHGQVAVSLRMSADTSRDRLALALDDTSIEADGYDTTRLTFRALDAYGNQRPYVTGDVTLSVAGPATLISENPFAFGTYGGVGGAFVRSQPGRPGLVTITARHPTLGHASTRLTVMPPTGREFL